MSGGDEEVRIPVITTKSTQKFHSWPITSLRPLVHALGKINCQFNNRPQVLSDLSAAESELAAANTSLDECSALSLEQAEQLGAAVDRAIAANEGLQAALQAADAARPESLKISYGGKSYNLVWKNGSYQIRWEEQKIFSDGVYSKTEENESARSFVNALTGGYVTAEDQFKATRTTELSRFNLDNAELEERMEQAIRIRGQWESIEDNRRIQHLRQERKNAVIEKASSLDMDCQVTEVGQEIILTIESSEFTQRASSGDPFGPATL
jgi:hypothetical protein